MKKLIVVLLTSLISIAVNAGSSGSCGTKVTCKAGQSAQCEMVDGTYNIFFQASFLNLTFPTDLFLSEVYAYKIQNIGTADCYYSRSSKPEEVVVFKTKEHHNVMPRDATEWIVRYDLLYCDPTNHSCYLYVLY